MKINKKIISITCVIIFICGICVFSVASRAMNTSHSEFPEEIKAKMSPEKRAFTEKIEEKIRKAESSATGNYKDIPKLDENALKEDSHDFKETGIIEKVANRELPMSYAESQTVIFDTCASLRHNLVVTGKSSDNPANGIIYNFYSKIREGIQTRYVYAIPGEGNITLTGVNKDKNTFTFKTQSGKTGVFDVSDGKGSYKLN